jgi:hypothetical protein
VAVISYQVVVGAIQLNPVCSLFLFKPAVLQDVDVAPMEDDSTAAAAADGGVDGADGGAVPGPSQLPEVELYSYLLVLVHLLDRKHFKQVRAFALG